MISTRNTLNQQAQAIGGQARRYEQPISSFTRRAMPTVAAMSRPQQTTPTQSTPTRQALGAPATLSAMAAGTIGGGTPQRSEARTPQGAFMQGVSRDMAIDMAVPALTRGALANIAAMSMGAPSSVLGDVALKGVIGSPLGALSSIANTAMGGYISGNVAEAFDDPQMDTETFNEITAMTGPESIDDPTEAFSPEQMADWDTTQQELSAYDTLTSNPLKPLGYLLGLVDMPSRQPTSLVGGEENTGSGLYNAVGLAMSPEERAAYSKEAVDFIGKYGHHVDPISGLMMANNPSALAQQKSEAIGDRMNDAFGNFSEAGKPMGGQVGDLDPSFQSMMDAFDSTFGGVFGGGGGGGGDGRSGATGGGYDASGVGGGIGNGPGGVGGIM